MDLRSVLPRYPSVDPPARLRELITAIKDLIRRVSALVDVSNEQVPDLRGIIDRLSVGDVGDFRAEAARAYERERNRRAFDARTLDFIEAEVRTVVIETGRVLRQSRDQVRDFAAIIDKYLVSPDFSVEWALEPQSVLRFLEGSVFALEQVERDVVATMELTAHGIEQWIDAVRLLGSPPDPGQQLAARDARLNEISPGIHRGMVEVTKQILERGDLILGDNESDVDLELWVTDHMKVLADNGVRVMLVDIPRTADHQRVLDDFATTGDIGGLTADLRAILPDTRSDESIAAAATMYNAAREHGIRVVAADSPYRYPLQITSDRLRLGIPFWAAGYEQARQEVAPNERVAIIADRGLSRSVGGIEGYFSNLYSIDQTHPHYPDDPDVEEGAVAVYPGRSIPVAPDVGVGLMRLSIYENADFVFRPPPR